MSTVTSAGGARDRDAAIMGKKEARAIPRPQGGWAVKRNGAVRASGAAETQYEAIAASRESALP